MIRDRIVVGIKDANLSVKMQLDPDLTLKKATDMARQLESVRKQQSLLRNDLCDTTVDAVKTKTRNQRETNDAETKEALQPTKRSRMSVMWTSPEPFKRQLPSKRSEML